jgi:hypothetical protein
MKIPEHPAKKRLRNRLRFNVGLFAIISAALLVAIVAVLLQGGLFMILLPVLTKLLLLSVGLLVLASVLLIFVNRTGGRIGSSGPRNYYIDV